MKRALESLGHTVHPVQEGRRDGLTNLIKLVRSSDRPQMVLWTRTKGLSDMVPAEFRWELLRHCTIVDVPTVGFHLDRWWGLKRDEEVKSDPFFYVDELYTADGGHDEQWRDLNICHTWMPPGVSEDWCHLGEVRDEYVSDIVFVGSWMGGYHQEWRHRQELVTWLSRTYKDRVQFWPKRGFEAVRGHDLCDLYASAKVVVGDSCLVPAKGGGPIVRYCSDRIPETLGRGGILLHPWVEGVTDLFKHRSWELGNFRDLKGKIDAALGLDDDQRLLERQASISRIRERHTYARRMEELIDRVFYGMTA